MRATKASLDFVFQLCKLEFPKRSSENPKNEKYMYSLCVKHLPLEHQMGDFVLDFFTKNSNLKHWG
jgi:hypothetical protein